MAQLSFFEVVSGNPVFGVRAVAPRRCYWAACCWRAVSYSRSHSSLELSYFSDTVTGSTMLKFIWGRGQGPTAERVKLQKELFNFSKNVTYGFPSKPGDALFISSKT